ncbi:MAG TPA: molybdate ABC transporter substrate-binding protein [Acidimicrobiales bacterium]|nr:molybdate ABC transporter substrate-binding protein [Acidimicrobiales bacterium]
MPGRLPSLLLAAAASTALLVGGCGSDPSTVSTPSVSARPAGPVSVFAAASLTVPFNEAKGPLTAANAGLSLTYSFAGSNALVTQITQGAPADVFASADTANMARLVDAGLVGAPVAFARNKLQIAVAAGNPRNITGIADLARPDLDVVLAAPGVPVGDYTRQVLADQRVTVAPRSLETDVRSAVAKVTSGEADATVVYVTDIIAAGAKVAGVSVPDAAQPAITYPIAVVKATGNPTAAQALVDAAVSGEVQKALRAAGFLPPG